MTIDEIMVQQGADDRTSIWLSAALDEPLGRSSRMGASGGEVGGGLGAGGKER